uniref:Uncharacterized protein n=1 Tax=Octopus bimaculoides TaxID=37653 RepID=A0A0L8G2P2_OCTBM
MSSHTYFKIGKKGLSCTRLFFSFLSIQVRKDVKKEVQLNKANEILEFTYSQKEKEKCFTVKTHFETDIIYVSNLVHSETSTVVTYNHFVKRNNFGSLNVSTKNEYLASYFTSASCNG